MLRCDFSTLELVVPHVKFAQKIINHFGSEAREHGVHGD